MALLSDNAERNASIVADVDNMDLLVVDRQLYSRTIKVWGWCLMVACHTGWIYVLVIGTGL